MPIIDTSKNGLILPELQVKRVAVRYNSNTILYPSLDKLKKHGGKKGYIDHYESKNNRTR